MKSRKTKLADHAEQLEAWFTATPPLTLDQARARLLSEHGLSVSASRLSTWWASREKQRTIAEAQAKVLASIASGAAINRAVTDAQAKDAPPEMLTIIGLLKTTILQQSVSAADNPESLALLPALMRPVIEWMRLQQARETSDLEREKFAQTLKTKIDAGLDELAAQIGADPEARRHYEAFRAVVTKATA